MIKFLEEHKFRNTVLMLWIAICLGWIVFVLLGSFEWAGAAFIGTLIVEIVLGAIFTEDL